MKQKQVTKPAAKKAVVVKAPVAVAILDGRLPNLDAAIAAEIVGIDALPPIESMSEAQIEVEARLHLDALAAAKTPKGKRAPRVHVEAPEAKSEAPVVTLPKVEAAPAKPVKASPVKYYLGEDVYPPMDVPDGVTRRFAYSFAILACEGLLSGAACPRPRFRKLFQASAADYHRKSGNLVDTAEGYKLTDKGAAHFSARKAQSEFYKAQWVEYFTRGAGSMAPKSGPIPFSM